MTNHTNHTLSNSTTGLISRALLLFAPGLLFALGCELGSLGSDDVDCEKVPELCPAGTGGATASVGGQSGSGGAGTSTGGSILACDDIFKPVCGKDGVTYSNDCYAKMANTVAVSDGECPVSEPQPCGEGSEACGADEFCYSPSGCGSNKDAFCMARPTACQENLAPVCGCDDKTYGNACAALSAGVNIASQGECLPPVAEEIVPCNDGYGPCKEGEFCFYPEEYGCGVDKKGGRCMAIPAECPDSDKPVCGCDGEEYLNSCVASMNSVSARFSGLCSELPVVCTQDGNECGEGQFCRFDSAFQCGWAGQAGLCAERPQACDLTYEPVCGCDQQTYDNSCLAAIAGVSVVHYGTCEEPQCGKAGEVCAPAEICSVPTGCGLDMGACVAKPDTCPDLDAPVCGCDGNTYPNSCVALAAGVNTAMIGECPPEGMGGAGHSL